LSAHSWEGYVTGGAVAVLDEEGNATYAPAVMAVAFPPAIRKRSRARRDYEPARELVLVFLAQWEGAYMAALGKAHAGMPPEEASSNWRDGAAAADADGAGPCSAARPRRAAASRSATEGMS